MDGRKEWKRGRRESGWVTEKGGLDYLFGGGEGVAVKLVVRVRVFE